MKARLVPLGRRYYGTVIEILDGPLAENTIEVWLHSDDWEDGGMEPSDRELAYHGVTREEHQRLYNKDCDDTPVDISGGHYENRDTYRVAVAIVYALSNL